MNTQHGVTLLEALVALSIMATIAAVSYAGLDTLHRTSARLEAEREMIGELALFFTRMENDMGNAVETHWRNGSGSTMPSMQGGAERITFVRMGDGVMIDNSGLVRIGYALSPGRIEYIIWPTLDGPPVREPRTYTAMEGVRGFSLSYMDDSGLWIDSWSEDHLPRAVKAIVTPSNGDTAWRVFDLR